MAQTTVKSEQIATNAISGTIIADNAITGVHIAQNAILTQHIDDGQVGTSQLAADAVTGAKLADSSVVTANIQDDQVTGDKLANNITIAGTLASTGVLTANAGVVIDNFTIDGTEIDLSSGDLTLDVAGNIILDADGAIWKFQDDGTEIFQINSGSQNANLKSTVQDKDIRLQGNDGGSTITALTLDMSDAGTAKFGHDIKMVDDGVIRLGDGNDLSLFHDASNSYITNDYGVLYIDQRVNDGNLILRCDDQSGGLAEYIALDGGAGDIYFKAISDIIHQSTSTNSTAGHHIFKSYNTEIMRIDGANNRVGIGTASPSAMLHLYKATGSGALEPELIIENNHNTSSVTDGAGRLTFYSDDSNNSGIPDLAWLGQVRFMGDDKDGSAQEFDYAYMVGLARDPGSGSTRKGGLSFYTRDGNSMTETMTITESKVGIGVTNPTARLQVSGGSANTEHVVISGSSNPDRGLSISTQKSNYPTDSGNHDSAVVYNAQDTEASSVYGQHIFQTGGTTRMQINSTSVVIANTKKLGLDGTVNQYLVGTAANDKIEVFTNTSSVRCLFNASGVTGVLNDTSDRALKENIVNLGASTTTLKALTPRTFDWKAETDADNQTGFIAQEIEAVNSNLVSGEEGHKAINTVGILAIAVKTIQELEARIATLEG